MLPTKAWIANPTSLGGVYFCSLYFEDPTRPQYLNVGDVVRDSRGYRYLVRDTTPLPYINGNTVHLSYVTNDVLPQADSGYDTTVYTLGQLDVRPTVRSSGEIFASSLYYGPFYEYLVSAVWSDPAQEAKAVVGDRVVDRNGKEYIISYIDSTSRFSLPFRVREVEKEGVIPVTGSATLYRATTNYALFQGTEVSDYARNIIETRDSYLIDKAMQSGVKNFIAGGPIAPGYPVGVADTGRVMKIDVSSAQLSYGACGIALNGGGPGETIFVRVSGDYPTTLSTYGLIWVNKDGDLISTKPSYGVVGFGSGDHLVCMGLLSYDVVTEQNLLSVNPRVTGVLG